MDDDVNNGEDNDKNNNLVSPNEEISGIPPPPNEIKESKEENLITPVDDTSYCPERPYYEKEEEENNTEEENESITEEKRYKTHHKTIFFSINFLVQIIQFSMIIILTIVGFYTGFSHFLIEDYQITIWVINTIVVCILCVILYFMKVVNEEPPRSDWLYIMNLIYIINIVIYCFLLSDFVKEIYIIIVLIIIASDLLALLLYSLIFKAYRFYGFLASPAIINIIEIILVQFLIGEFGVTWRIMIIAIAAIIYFTIITQILLYLRIIEEYRFCILIYNLAIFFPVAAIFYIIVIYLICFEAKTC